MGPFYCPPMHKRFLYNVHVHLKRCHAVIKSMKNYYINIKNLFHRPIKFAFRLSFALLLGNKNHVAKQGGSSKEDTLFPWFRE